MTQTIEMPATSDTFKNILSKMDFYSRQYGYLGYAGGELTFFDSCPSFGGAYVTREDVLSYFDDSIKQDNILGMAKDNLYYGRCGDMMHLAAQLYERRYNELMAECVRLGRFVDSLKEVSPIF